ncbi:MAG: CvpA family protein [Bacteroidetes bacterium]|nr:CvpA family protein [Bacteroidota bacterium]
MNYIDIILAVLLLTGLVRGFMKGFVFEIAVLGAFFLGMFAGFHFAYVVQPWLLKIGKMNPQTLSFISFITVFILVSVGIFFLAKLFEGLINIAALGIFNKILGAVFGLLKYAFVISLVLYFFNRVDTQYHYVSADAKAESHLYYPVLKLSPVLLPVLEEIRKDAGEKINRDIKK